MTIVNAPVFPYTVAPIANIAPFTYQDGLTFAEVFANFRDYITNTLVPYIESYATSDINAYNAAQQALATAMDNFNTTAAADIAQINNVLAEVNTALTNANTDANNAAASATDAAASATNAAQSATLADQYAKPTVFLAGPGIDTTGVTDSTTAIQAIFDNAVDGAAIYAVGTFLISAPINITKNVTLFSRGLSDTFGSRNTGSLDHPAPPYIYGGAIFVQNTSGANIFNIETTGLSVNFDNIGGKWLSATTGHGIYAVSSTNYQTSPDTGLASFWMRNVRMYGVDGNHYALYLVNPLLGSIDGFYSYMGGGGFYIEGNGPSDGSAVYGNMVVTNTYAEVVQAGTADGYHLKTNSTGTLNLITFIRPQCNITGAALTQGTQCLWNGYDGAIQPSRITVIDPDMEAWGGNNPIKFGSGIGGGTTVVGSGVQSAAPQGGLPLERASGYQSFTATTTWTPPAYVRTVRVRSIGGGGGGGGGGTSNGTINQVGGGGGGAGAVVEAYQSITPGVPITITVGTGGAGGVGGAAGGASGANGSPGTVSWFRSSGSVNAQGGGGGVGGGASSISGVGGGLMGSGGYTTTSSIPGAGGSTQNSNGISAQTAYPGVVGGGGGGAANATNGGGGGTASNSFPAGGSVSGGTWGASTTANGTAGTSSTAAGNGGGGGGGGATATGTGGNGGSGGPGLVEVWW